MNQFEHWIVLLTPALLALGNMYQKHSTNGLKDQITIINQNTNGRLMALIKKVEELQKVVDQNKTEKIEQRLDDINIAIKEHINKGDQL